MQELIMTADIAILKSYNPLLEHHYNTYLMDGQESMVEQITYRIDVPENQMGIFEERFYTLMKRLNVPEDHHGYLIYIVQNYYNKSDYLDEYLLEYVNGLEILNFFKDYKKQS